MLKVVFLLGCILTLTSCEDLVVNTRNGQLRGISVNSTLNGFHTYYAYLGIPYAAPPVGKLRFQPPQPVANWNGIRDASNNSISCYQVGAGDNFQSEDCLYLSVYTPARPNENKKLAVAVYMHAGTFTHGHASYGTKQPAFLMAYNIVLVTINYRVGPFGFLTTGDTVIPGNMGLKDQQLTLKWVQQNIEFFGGDPQKVTIMGQSAGSASVSYHLLSPGSRGLFRAVVGISGTALTEWAYQRHAVDTAYGIAAEINPSFNRSRSTQDLANFLMSVDASQIVKTQDKYMTFSPVIEVAHDGAFISNYMYNIADQGEFGRVPVLMGFNSEEGIAIARDLDHWKRYVSLLDSNPRNLVGDEMYITDDNIKLEVGNLIRKIYMGNQPFGNNYGKAVQYYSDKTFIRSIVKFADLIMPHTDVYFYEFAYHGIMGQNNVSFPGIGKVGHAEDQFYFWAYLNDYSSYPEADVKTQQRYIRLIANFILFLNPIPPNDQFFGNVQWPKATRGNFSYLEIDTELSVKQNPRGFSYGPWVQIFEKYVKKPFISF